MTCRTIAPSLKRFAYQPVWSQRKVGQQLLQGTVRPLALARAPPLSDVAPGQCAIRPACEESVLGCHRSNSQIQIQTGVRPGLLDTEPEDHIQGSVSTPRLNAEQFASSARSTSIAGRTEQPRGVQRQYLASGPPRSTPQAPQSVALFARDCVGDLTRPQEKYPGVYSDIPISGICNCELNRAPVPWPDEVWVSVRRP